MLPLSSGDRRSLLAIARNAITLAISSPNAGESKTVRGPVGAVLSENLAEPRGVFVTLYLRNRLRGCMGQVETGEPLADTVACSAVSAALRDPRFAPVQATEVGALQIEISALSPLQPISADAIVNGRHGLLVVQAEKRGLLLPQVATDRCWTAQRFLEETCLKAGLAADAARESQTKLFGFTAEVFSEADFPAAYSITA